MTLAMAAVGDLVSPRERGRYQGYIAATFAVATVVGPLIGGVLVEQRQLALGVLRQPAARRCSRWPACACGCRRPTTERPDRPLDALGAALLAGATSALMLACIWGGDRYAWGSPRSSRWSAPVVLGGGAGRARAARGGPDRPARPAAHPDGRGRQRGAVPRPPPRCSRSPCSSRCSCRRRRARARPRPGLLLVPMMLGMTLSTTLAGRSIERTGRYKRFPVAGLALMSAALVAARRARRQPVAHRDRRRPGACSGSASAWSGRC